MDLTGKKLGQYRIAEELGRGGMAVVYQAYQPSLNRQVAIKVLQPQFTLDEGLVQRFLGAARSAATVRHPNIVTIYDIGHQHGLYFIVMELVEGKTLDQLLAKSGRMPLPRTQHIISQVASALEHGHQYGLIHLDIKPTNIMVDEQHNDYVTVMGFWLMNTAGDAGSIKPDAMPTTPEYTAPEVLQGDEVDKRTDIYSLGVVLFEMLTGQAPFSGSTPFEVLTAHTTQVLPSVRSIDPGLPSSIEAVVRRTLAEDPGARYQTTRAFARALNEAGA